MRLTRLQTDNLIRIAAGGGAGFPHAGWFGSRPERALEDKGLVQHYTHVSRLGGGGSIGALTVRWELAKLTPKGEQVVDKILIEMVRRGEVPGYTIKDIF